MCKGEGEGVDAISAVRFNLLGAPKRIHSDNAAEYSSEQCGRYTKRAKSYTHDHTYTRDGHVIQRIARSAHQTGDVSIHRRISPALPAIRVAFAPAVPVVNSHVRLLHLQFLYFITPTKQASCQSLLHHTLLALTITAPASFEVHGVAKTV